MILSVFVNKVVWFNLFVGRKKMTSSCFTLCFEKVIPSHTNGMRKNCLSAKYCKENTTGWLLQPLECCCFNIEKKMILKRVFRQERPYDIRSYDRPTRYIFFYSFIINNAQISLLTVFNSKWLINKARKTKTKTQKKQKQNKKKKEKAT